MKHFYNYVVHPNNNSFSFDEPLSSMLVSTLEQAYKWAERLMKFHPNAWSISFKRENGRKVYFIQWEDNNLIRGKY